jgi:peptidoglycan/LPS O-acetylase OafA/YrhL
MNQQTLARYLVYWLAPSRGCSFALTLAGSYFSSWLGFILAAICLLVSVAAAMFGIIFPGKHESILFVGGVMFLPGLVGVILGIRIGTRLRNS